MIDELGHWSIKLDEAERDWLEKLVHQVSRQTLNYEALRLALELAYKKGKFSAWKN